MMVLLGLLAVTVVLLGILTEPVLAQLARNRTHRLTAGGLSLLTGGTITVAMGLLLTSPQLTGPALAADQDAAASAVSSDATRPVSRSDAEDAAPSSATPSSATLPADSTQPDRADGSTLDSVDDQALAELDVELPPRPSWVSAARDLRGDVHQFAVSSELHARVQESRRSLEEELQKATNDYIAEYLGSNRAPLLINYDTNFIREHLVVEEFTDTVKVSFGPMHQSHALLDFNLNFRQNLRERWQQILTVGRLLKTGVLTAGILALLGVVFGYFKLDTATRGYYSSRLRFAAALAITGLLVAGVLFARTSVDWIRWLL